MVYYVFESEILFVRRWQLFGHQKHYKQFQMN